ncbi:hypothetical protein [Flexibacterium corallicola]|uniref:hypothetical protein n=1 Tax=Flexibacterium corallicola TaxID=3037259 RepID=UPI00286ED6DE|nr:hypothetical protein [Pseudovibrio sp. M1P-2-3]
MYTVTGKGGLRRLVLVPPHLIEAIEARRVKQPREVKDRNVFYNPYYNIGGGNAWSASFTEASKRALGWSKGAHGLRHSYAQERMLELQVTHKLEWEQALETVSQEMGHFRPEITMEYLR